MNFILFSNRFTMNKKWIKVEPFRVGYDPILEPQTKSCLPISQMGGYLAVMIIQLWEPSYLYIRVSSFHNKAMAIQGYFSILP